MTTPWSSFFQDKIIKIFSEKKSVIDIGGGLRISRNKGSRFDASRSWLTPLVEKVDYKVLDPVDTYKPDIVGDIHNLPLGDSTQDAILCIAVLEHVENPIKAFEEMYRALKPGGYLFVYVPFLYYYHAEKGYYGDYWRFTEDTLKYLAKPFAHYEINPVRGAIGTLTRLTPLGRSKFFEQLAYMLDRLTGKLHSKQVSGYQIFLVK